MVETPVAAGLADIGKSGLSAIPTRVHPDFNRI